MARTQVQYGSQGGDVKALQEILNKNGYSLDVDGIFGSKTQSAVKDYQQKNGLDVDGIVGVNTWSSLDGSSGKGTTSKDTTPKFEYKDFSYDDYQESDVVTEAKKALDAQLSKKPGEYKSQWQAQLDETMNKILNREEFSYDFNGDALYQQYKDKYIKQGKMAMADAIGQASAMTGGYGNSYAQSVGQQQYQASLENLNDIVPELYQMAYDKYNQEGQDLYNQAALLGDRENQDYSKYRDTVADWQTERDYLQGRYDSERDYDYSKYADGRDFAYGTYSDDKAYAYQDHRDTIADQQWQAEFDEAKRQYNEQMAFQKQQYEDSKVSYSSGGSSSGGSSGGSYKGSSSSGSSGSGSSGANVSGVSSEIKKKAESFKSNTSLASYLDGLEASGTITSAQADQLYAQYADDNEKYTKNKDGSSSASYKSMVGSTNGWSVVDDGGINWLWGIDNNAIVEAPNGEKIRLDALKDKLISEGMSKKDAKNAVKKLQKNLGA